MTIQELNERLQKALYENPKIKELLESSKKKSKDLLAKIQETKSE